MGPRRFSFFGRGSSSSAPENVMEEEEEEEQSWGGAVLVELFTSQGCSSCPKADQLVSRLGMGDDQLPLPLPPVVVLGFHVDYWDYLGWKDPFASNIWTLRQKAHARNLRSDSLYTPQVVVHGRAHCVGSNRDALLSAVRSAPRFPSPTFQASFLRPSADKLQVSLTGQLGTNVDSKGADVMVALYENGLVTECTGGENRGRLLSNDFVVRKLEKLCSVTDVSADSMISGTITFSLPNGFNSGKSGVVLFVQNSSLHPLGVQQFHLPHHAL